MVLKHKYIYFKNAFPKHLCQNIIKYGLSKGQAHDAFIGDKNRGEVTNHRIRKSDVDWLEDKWLNIKLYRIIEKANEIAGWNFHIDAAEPVQFTIYKPGMHYDWHEDAFVGTYDRQHIPYLNGKARKLSLSMLLSDFNEYKGGEFEVDFGNRKEPTRTVYEMQNQGDAIVFPSDLLHKIRPVTHGTRYSLVMWSVGWPFK